MNGPLTEPELIAAYRELDPDATGVPVEVHAALNDALAQLAGIRAELATVRELLELVVAELGRE